MIETNEREVLVSKRTDDSPLILNKSDTRILINLLREHSKNDSKKIDSPPERSSLSEDFPSTLEKERDDVKRQLDKVKKKIRRI